MRKCIATRLHNLQVHNRDPVAQAIARARSAVDIGYWFDDWVWTFDPRLDQAKYVPFDLFPKQREFIGWLEERERTKTDGIGVKSRDCGFSWLCVGFAVHRWLFRDGYAVCFGSRKEEYIDNLGDPKSIFEKIRLLLQYLPAWMMPEGFDRKKHDNFCKLINPATRSTITGEAGDNIGRGGRSTIYFVDESAYLERPQKVDAALSANTNVRVDISTPNGMGNPFFTRWASGNVASFEMGWEDDPRKNRWEIVRSDGAVIDSGPGGTPLPASIPDGCIARFPWYEAEKRRLANPVIVAQEIDRDFTASIEGVVIPARWVQSAVNLHRRVNMPESDYVVAGLDVADGGASETVLILRRGPIVESVRSRTEGNTTDTANWAMNTARDDGARVLAYDAIGVGAGVAATFEVRNRSELNTIETVGVNVGEPASESSWPNGKTGREMFANTKAELWWMARRRFERTHEFVEDGIPHPLDELISIPDHPKLIQQLSLVTCGTTETGKVQIESKQKLKKRGVASPDYAEALILSLAVDSMPATISTGGRKRESTRWQKL